MNKLDRLLWNKSITREGILNTRLSSLLIPGISLCLWDTKLTFFIGTIILTFVYILNLIAQKSYRKAHSRTKNYHISICRDGVFEYASHYVSIVNPWPYQTHPRIISFAKHKVFLL